MTIETKPFDAAELLNNGERTTACHEEALESRDPSLIASAIGDIARTGLYPATPDELAAIDRGLEDARRGRFASEAMVAAVRVKFRGA